MRSSSQELKSFVQVDIIDIFAVSSGIKPGNKAKTSSSQHAYFKRCIVSDQSFETA